MPTKAARWQKGSEEGNAALAEIVVDPVVEQCGSGVSTEWGEKD